jgi:hypothetical protein
MWIVTNQVPWTRFGSFKQTILKIKELLVECAWTGLGKGAELVVPEQATGKQVAYKIL